MELKITSVQGKMKTEVLNKHIVRIGSDVLNDVCLQGGDIQPFHLQILSESGEDGVTRVVNLTDQPVGITLNRESYWLNPYASAELSHEDEIELGDYAMVVNLPIKDGLVRNSKYFEAALAFPSETLPTDSILEGHLTIRNLGQKGAQFKVDVEGLPENCFQIDEVPLLYPSAVEDVNFRVIHQGVVPQAGYVTFYVSITSPDHYPDEQVVLQYNIYIAPQYRQKLGVFEVHKKDLVAVNKDTEKPPRYLKKITFDDAAEEVKVQRVVPKVAEVSTPPQQPPQETVAVNEEREQPVIEEEVLEEGQVDEASEAIQEEQPILDRNTENQGIEKPKLKVIRNQFDDFWKDESLN